MLYIIIYVYLFIKENRSDTNVLGKDKSFSPFVTNKMTGYISNSYIWSLGISMVEN